MFEPHRLFSGASNSQNFWPHLKCFHTFSAHQIVCGGNRPACRVAPFQIHSTKGCCLSQPGRFPPKH